MKIKKLNNILVFLLAIIMVLSVVACGGKSDSDDGNAKEAKEEDKTSEDSGKKSDSGETVQITFWHAMGGSIGKALEEIVADYNQSQDKVEVVAQYQGTYDDTLTKLRSSAAGSDVNADLVQVFEMGTQFLIDSGLIVPMQDMIDKSKFDTSVLEENLLAYYTLNGKLYSMPFNSSTPLMYYNKTAFDDAGITDIPTNIEEIKEIADKITGAKSSDSTTVQYPMSVDIYGWYMEQWLNKTGKDTFDHGNGREDHATKAAFDENGSMLKVVSMWKDVADSGVMPNNGREGGNAEFVAGTSAITLASTANLNQILTEVGGRFEVGTAYFPGIDAEDKAGVSIGGASLWMIDSGDDTRKDATWDFVQYLVSADVQAKWNVATGYFPVNTGAHDTDVFKENIEKNPQFKTAIDQLHDATADDQGAISGVNQEARTYYEAELEKALNGEKTPEEAVAAMAEQVNAALDSYNAAK
ncbi:MAG: ABC transporter substrate-binding protein [Saccharofermentanales bacterium]|jgi:sn-glycerol 3-phosphate transport system substrate-binding protein